MPSPIIPGFFNSAGTVNVQTGTTYTLQTTDDGNIVSFENAASTTVTVPLGLGANFRCILVQTAAAGRDARIILAPDSGVTIQGINNAYRTRGPGSKMYIMAYAANLLNVEGDVQTISTPLEISGCVFWLDAADGNSVTQAAGVISQVNDKSGNNFHVTAAGGAQPTYRYGDFGGRNCIRFDGTSDFLQNASSTLLRNLTGWTSFTVSRANSATPAGGSPTVWSVNTGNTKAQEYITLTTGLQSVSARRVQADANAALSGIQANILITQRCCIVDHSTTSARTYINGVADATSSSFGTAGTSDNIGGDIYIGAGVLGSSNWWPGDICEVILFNSVLSDLNRKRVEGYLRTKWPLP